MLLGAGRRLPWRGARLPWPYTPKSGARFPNDRESAGQTGTDKETGISGQNGGSRKFLAGDCEEDIR